MASTHDKLNSRSEKDSFYKTMSTYKINTLRQLIFHIDGLQRLPSLYILVENGASGSNLSD